MGGAFQRINTFSTRNWQIVNAISGKGLDNRFFTIYASARSAIPYAQGGMRQEVRCPVFTLTARTMEGFFAFAAMAGKETVLVLYPL